MKYKLIKTYPGSADIGYECMHMYNAIKCEDYPEFWEKVVKRDYEILSFVHDGSNGVTKGVIASMDGEWLDRRTQKLNISHYIKSSCWSIHSVRRIQDGEVFTIGDWTNAGRLTGFEVTENSLTTKHSPSEQDVNDDYYLRGLKKAIKKDYEILEVSYGDKSYDRFDGNYYYDKSHPIILDHTSRIYIKSLHVGGVNITSIQRKSDDEIFTVGDRCNPTKYPNNIHAITAIEFCRDGGPLRLRGGNWYMNVNGIEHSKNVLFTTEDGVEVVEGIDFTCYQVSKVNGYHYRKCDKRNIKAGSFSNKSYYFSTEESAEAHILNNKQHLSINDICNIPGLNMTNMRAKLTEFVLNNN